MSRLNAFAATTILGVLVGFSASQPASILAEDGCSPIDEILGLCQEHVYEFIDFDEGRCFPELCWDEADFCCILFEN